tara:strand:- start:3233 stop:3958 length:726 start_codon:yes stop_codon:yes gene_type:complete
MTNFEENKFNLELIIGLIFSIFLHGVIFLLEFNKENITRGDKFIPVEILNEKSNLSEGNSLLKVKENNNESLVKTQEKKTIKNEKNTEEEFLDKDNININIPKNKQDKKKVKKEIIKKNKNKESRQILNKKENEKVLGASGKNKNEELEKGSIKGQGEIKITCLNCFEPKYPKLAIKRGYEGIMKLKIWIRKNGTVSKVKVVKSSGYNILDLSGIKAANNSTFYPIQKETTLNIEYNLKLN